MLRVTRNVLARLVVGFMLFSYTNADAKSKYYKVNIDGTHTTWYPGSTSSSYNIWIDEPFAVPDFPSIHQHNPCRYGCVESSEFLTRCTGSGIHIGNVPGIINQVFEEHKREQERKRLVNAQVELLEAQTALLRQQARANSRPYRPPSEAVQQAARKRLAARYATQSKPTYIKPKSRPGISTIIERVRTGEMTPQEAIALWEDTIGRGDYMRHQLREEGLMGPKPSTSTKPIHIHKQSALSKLAMKLGLKKSHRCTADCVD